MKRKIILTKLKNAILNNSFSTSLPADKESKNFPRQVFDACYSWVKPKKTTNPKLIIVSDELLEELDIEDANSKSFLNIVTGNELIEDSKPYAMCYGGHQFGHWAGQLGDGRAINLAQIESKNKIYTLQLKGAGLTPYSRTADGLAVLRSSVREFLCSEAMYHLGVSSTRALSLSLTGDKVLRDVLYNGNPDYEPGAIVCRVSESFIRFGSFQIFAARKDFVNLKKITDYTIQNYYSHLGTISKETYIAFFREVALKTADMIVDWQRVGFVHGVMNTDNMSILGQTIDYGPYGWIENFDLNWTPNTTDAQNKRYRFGNQASIALWNLVQLANSLFPLIENVKALEEILEEYKKYYLKAYAKMQYAKIGLFQNESQEESFLDKLLELLQVSEIDMTIFYRNLACFKVEKAKDYLYEIQKASYLETEDFEKYKNAWIAWLEDYSKKLNAEDVELKFRQEKMNKINPKYVLRNYMAQLAIEDAEKGKYELITELYGLLKKPYSEQKSKEKWFSKRPNWALNKIGCSQLSCSS
ncbi:MAG: protein adenylyltransferase SelO [Chitinophagales bacterium]